MNEVMFVTGGGTITISAHFIEKKSRYEYLFLRAFKGGKI